MAASAAAAQTHLQRESKGIHVVLLIGGVMVLLAVLAAALAGDDDDDEPVSPA